MKRQDGDRKDAAHASVVGDVVHLSGDWTVDNLPSPHSAFGRGIDTQAVDRLDAFGACEILRLRPDVLHDGVSVLKPAHRRLVETLAQDDHEVAPIPRQGLLAGLGKGVVHAGAEFKDMFAIQGRMIVTTVQAVISGKGIRPAAIANQFMEMVLKAIPIVCLISFVVGIILTQQSILQLRNFGATMFVADLAGILMLREVGVLLAAIMVAGRSGSAIAAEIGAMRMREEVDALEVMGVDPYRAVVLPRAWALVLGMPALALLGAIAGIVGAAMIARAVGDVSLPVFMSRLHDVIDLKTILIGVAKAPVMAVAIVIIAVREGFQVGGSTESLGRHTTASVVKSIFAVIVIDGLFAVYLAAMGI